MKLDQETIVKHQFWFLLGSYFLVWLIAVLCLKFIAPDKIDKLKKDYEGAASGVKSAQAGPVNTATFLPPWEKEAKAFNGHKSVIWADAWKWQAGMYDWPEAWHNKYDMTTPQAPLSPDDRNEYRDKLYPNQIENLRTNSPKWINPVELKESFDSVFKPMTRQEWKETPTREEIWLAQEDFWIKRELFVVVVDAIARQAVMPPKAIDDKKEPMPKGVEARYRFANKNWEITLNIRKNDKGYFVIGGDSTIKNIHPNHHPQPLTSAKGKGIWFNVAQDNVRTLFEVRGEPVSWNESKEFSRENYPEPLSGIKWDKEWVKEHPIVVSQGFDRTNCPIRRINAMELAKQDCRTFIWPLQQNNALAQLDALPDDDKSGGGASPGGAAAPGGAPPGPGGPAVAGASPGGPGMMGMGGPQAPVGNRTPNNEIERDRYLQPASQDKAQRPPSRHLPLAFQLIVEQSHMHDVLMALANSRLRFQITQVEFKHEKDYMPQSEDDKDKKDGADMAGPRVFGGGMPAMAGAPSERRQMEVEMQRSRQYGGNMQSSPMEMQRMRQYQMQREMMMRSPSPGVGPNQMRPTFSYAPGSMRPGGPVAMPNGIDPKQTASNQQDDNLVELSIYGIATLYRSPDAPQTTEQASPSGQPGSPAPQAGQPAPATATPPTGNAQPAPQAPATATPPPGNAQPAPQAPATATPPPATPPSGSPPAAPKQPDKSADQQKAPPPPPAGDKKN